MQADQLARGVLTCLAAVGGKEETYPLRRGDSWQWVCAHNQG